MKPKSYDIILRHVEGYGWLPIIERDGKEVYRGEFRQTSISAVLACEEWDHEQETVEHSKK